LLVKGWFGRGGEGHENGKEREENACSLVAAADFFVASSMKNSMNKAASVNRFSKLVVITHTHGHS